MRERECGSHEATTVKERRSVKTFNYAHPSLLCGTEVTNLRVGMY